MRKRLCVAACLLAFVLTGCASVPELTQDDNDMAAQYMAGELLKYDRSYVGALDYDRAILEPTPAPVPTASPKPQSTDNGQNSVGNPSGTGASQAGTDNPVETVKEVSIEELYGVSGVSLKQTGYSLRSRYLLEDSSDITADEGEKLFVVSFKLKNTTKSKVDMNINKDSITYSLQIGESGYGRALQTVAKGDIQFFHEKIDAGKSKKGILIFSIPEKVKVEDAVIVVGRGKKVARIQIH